jgi:hypothetical protein
MEMAISYLNNSEERFDEVINTQPPEEPGFEAIYSIAGLLIVFYVVRRKFYK